MTVGNMESAALFDAGAKGRGLRATRDLAAGEVVFAEPSYSAVVYDSFSTQVCHSCFRHQAQLHRCAQCKFAHYCDRTCQTACWEEHKQECGAIRRAGQAPGHGIRLAARVLWRVHKDGGVASDSQLVPVEQLQEHVADLSEPDAARLAEDVRRFLQFWSQGRERPSAERVSRVFAMIRCNGFALRDQRGLQAVGLGLFPNLGLVNHDCWPNCSVVLNHGSQSALSSALHSQRRIELRALEKVPEGAELTVSYVDFLDVSSERQRKLRERFHFDCGCDHCGRRLKDDLMTAATASAEKVKEVTALSRGCLEKMEACRAQGDFCQAVQLGRQCLERQQDVLGDTHLDRLRVLSALSEVLAHLKAFPEAADHARKMVDGYAKLYHPNNAQLGLATMRAGVAHWHGGLIEAGHALICRAYGVLMVTHGPNHAVSRALESMRAQSELELKVFRQKQSAMSSEEKIRGFFHSQ